MQEEEDIGQQGYIRHLSISLPLEVVGQEWLGGLGPGERQMKPQKLEKWGPCKEVGEGVITGALF